MDVESSGTIKGAEDHAADIASGLVDKAGGVLAADLNTFVVNISNTLNGLAQLLQGTADKFIVDANTTLSSLDGWTLDISPITIRLSKPK